VSTDRRVKLITELETKLKAKLLVLVTGDRRGMETRIASDIIPLVSGHLNRMGSQERIALFLYTPGGDMIAGWGLVNLLRQYCQKFVVLVPFRALSCGTLVALGADQLIIGKHGLLSPVDPSVNSPFNPTVQAGAQAQLLPVSVEDMIGFFDLAKNQANLKSEESMTQVLKILADKVHPLALGAVYRAREQSSSLAERLLSRHMTDESHVRKIVKRLTEELPTHSYLIGRSEAEEIGIPVEAAPDDVDALMWELYKEYEVWLRLTQPVSQELDLGTETQARITYDRAAVESVQESTLHQYIFRSDLMIVKIKHTPQGTTAAMDQIVQRVMYEGWVPAANGEVIA
jgi:hypothetical protein